MSRPLHGILLVLVLSACAFFPRDATAEPVPFNMGPERLQLQDLDAPLPGIEPTPGAADVPAFPSRGPLDSDAGSVPADNPAADAPVTTRRFVVPDGQLQLRGEIDRRAWSVVLTAAQAEAAAALNITYQNSVFVAPEFSELSVLINGEPILKERIASPDKPEQWRVDIPGGVLRAGRNEFAVFASQRHRTDCHVESTFELWTNIVTAGTYLSFGNGPANRLSSISGLSAIGNDADGVTPIHIIAPQIVETSLRDELLRLAQNIALIANMPRQSISVFTSVPENPARLTVFFGTNDHLSVFPGLGPQMGDKSFAGFIEMPPNRGHVLLVSGRNLIDVQEAARRVATVASQTEPDADLDVLRTQNRFWPQPPMINRARSVSLADLGLETREFSGRLFRTEFEFGLPEDFYAKAYGYFQILMDAAYSSSVLPGSSISVYVNGNIASNLPINQVGGSIMNGAAISVPLRNARPGLNRITIEGRFDTAEDALCAPGTTGNADQRFVLFDTTRIVFPELARLGQLPNLESFSGFGFPYSKQDDTTRLFLADFQESTLSAAATLLSSLSVAAGRPIGFTSTGSVPITLDDSALFIGNISALPREALSYVGLSSAADSEWAKNPLTQTDTRPLVLDNEETLENWRSKLAEGGWSGRLMRWMRDIQENLDLSDKDFSLRPAIQGGYVPPAATDLLIAQNSTEHLPGAWTVVTAPNSQRIDASVSEYLTYKSELGGNISAIRPSLGQADSIQTEQPDLFFSGHWSIANIRMVATNWLSVNALKFCAILFVVVILFGTAAAGLLRVSGRRS
ncbi:cellulose biosynthesis cyclic di-GMP-binding regulatory protein BcsB [Roseibium sp. RKSG952]|uniref:cellulose biosynthesis cyclic di-GMP-binding regulatory protein BcsB n=1 Tax=Roseibium sp. RKSG952 TaxID=2529384 RepID=UPI0012BCA45B|nr:cellulose biosynthesis cyclic di-GMP-binding regulatory protein BcsB [Roseibium sp. RKSG952]MTH99309.1 hypothetical protein [Roseibium sp. RKSG952]